MLVTNRMVNLYWTAYDRHRFGARHLLEMVDIAEIRNHNHFWPAGTSIEFLETLLRWLNERYQQQLILPSECECGPGFVIYDYVLDNGFSVRLGINSRGRVLLLQPLDGPNVIKVNAEEACRLFNHLHSS